MTAAVADHKLDPYLPALGGDRRNAKHVQIDHHAAGAVRIDQIGAGFPPCRRKVGAREVVALVITLRQIAVTVEDLDTGDDLRRNRRFGGGGGGGAGV
jgi:hypothetical protein